MSKISEKLNTINKAKNDIKTAIENKGVTVGDISITDYANKINEIVGEDVSKPEQEKSVNPTTKKQTVLPDEGYTLSKVEVEAIPTETKTVTNVDFSNDNMIITATDSKYMTSVEISKPTTLIAENVKKDVNIAGIVGTLESGGSADFEINDSSYLFYGGARLNYLNEILALCKNVISMKSMFHGCKFTTIDLKDFDTSQTTDMNSLFNNCSNLKEIDLTDWDISNVTTFNNTFNGCINLETINLSNLNANSLIDTERMFTSCNKLKTINFTGFTASLLTSMASMFMTCQSIVTLDLSGFDVSKVENVNSTFVYMGKLENLTFMKNLGKGFTRKSNNYSYYKIDFSQSTNLTHESLMSIINNLYDLNLTYDVANGGTLYTQQLIIGATNISKLTADEIAIATNKGWVVN